MRICGIDLGGADCVLAVLERSEAGEITCVPTRPPKLTLPDEQNAQHVKNLFETLAAFMREHRIDLVAVKARAKKGKFAGGAVSFKLEGLVQLLDVPNISLVAANRIANVTKGVEIPGHLNKYQEDAFRVAYCAAASAK